ncbi:DUF3568 domain-containing protein [bacterium]|nr:DUF3568 domain-containing protein [bacterium]
MQRKYFILSMIAILTSTGCGLAIFAGGATVGVGGALYISGALENEFTLPSAKVWIAVQSAAKTLNFKILKKTEKDYKYILQAKDIDGRNIRIDVIPLTGERSKIFIRVDTFGDEAYSRKILKAIVSEIKN